MTTSIHPKKPAISVIVPVYNVEEYLLRCTDSILNQTFTNFELILIDDASPDSSPKICDQIAQQDPRVVVRHLAKNVGLSGARNTGLDIAKGEFVAFVDSDDWIDQLFLEVLYSKAMETNSDIAACPVIRTHTYPEAKKPHFTSGQKDKTFDIEGAIISVLTNHKEIGITTPNKLYRKSLFEKIRFPVGLLHEDTLTTYKLAANSNRAVFTADTCYYYFQSNQSITRGAFNTRRLDIVTKLDEVDDYLRKAGYDLQEAIQFYKYSFRVGLLNDLLEDKALVQERNKLMNLMRKEAMKIVLNKYSSAYVRASALLLYMPPLYSILRKIRNRHFLEITS